jgi:surface protein
MNRLKKVLFVVSVLLTLFSVQVAAEAYAVWCEGNTTLYFLNSGKELKAGDAYSGQTITSLWSGNDVVASAGKPAWLSTVAESATHVVFDKSFSTVTPTRTASWFFNFNKLEDFKGLEYLNTSQVTDMSAMFGECHELKLVDMSSFDTGNVTNMNFMFQTCRNLAIIYVGDKWTTANVKTGDSMFWACASLRGSDGSKVTQGAISVKWAHTGEGGYLTLKNADYKIPHALWCEGNATLYFIGSSTELKAGDTYKGQRITNVWTEADIRFSPDFTIRRMWPDYPAWLKTVQATVAHVVFEESFKSTIITEAGAWFMDCENLEDITGLEYLNTSKVKSMSGMFEGCKKLRVLDVSHFDTSNVIDLSGMFLACLKLEVLDLSSFDTSKVTQSVSWMFASCLKLRTIYISEKWDVSHIEDNGNDNAGYGMFYQCSELVGQDGTEYKWEYDNYTYAHANAGGYMTMKTPGTEVPGNVPYIVFDENTHTLTFYYDKNQMSRNGTYIKYSWGVRHHDIRNVVFDPSFDNYTGLTSTANFFKECEMKSITGIEYLHTENVTDMSGMFADCFFLESLDLSHFDTKNVTDMSEMFSENFSLKALDVSHFNTEKVQNMSGMFSGCSGVTEFDISHFDTSNVTDMSKMFSGCGSCKTFDLSHFDTRKVQNMNHMFNYCSALESIDLNNFDVSNVQDFNWMFTDCKNLSRIYCDNTWTSDNPTNMMFYNCFKLPGYSSKGPHDITRAKPTILGGFFSSSQEAAEPEPYTVYDNGTLTFYYDTNRPIRGGMIIVPVESSEELGWAAYRQNVTTVVFDPSFANCTSLTSTAWWFFSFDNLTTITGMKNLKTDNVTTMHGMFCRCYRLRNVDVSGFNTANVTDMGQMFDTCYELEALDLKHFDTSNVEWMNQMFPNCTSLTSLDLTSFNTQKVKNMFLMFGNCSSLTAIYCDDTWSTEPESYMMFAACDNLPGYSNDNANDASFARPTYLGGYFTSPANLNAYLTVTGKNYSRAYGEANPTFEYEVNGGWLEGEPVIECQATESSPAGTYRIVIKPGSVKNYYVYYYYGTLTVTKAPLTVKAEDAVREQGQENPTFVLSYEGWKLQDTEDVLTEKPTAWTSATKDSPMGDYDIVVSGGEAQNYEFKYVNGKLTVTESSGIGELQADDLSSPVYNLSGQRLATPRKGLNIRKGKKIVLK